MTVSLNLSDTLVDAVVAKLTAEMPARVATIRSESAAASEDASWLISPPAQIVPDGINEVAVTPTLVVMEGRTSKIEWSSIHEFIPWTQIHVVIFEEAIDRGVLARKLRRQARAVIESIWDSAPQQQLDSPAAPGTRIKMVSFDPGPAGRATQGNLGWRGTYVVTFLAQQLEGS